ncbi:MAG: hypothetical protein AAGB13_14060 [Cyanobacteria bacterium P01_F01_bin.33]
MTRSLCSHKINHMIEIAASNFEIDPPTTRIKEWWQAELNIQATLTVTVDGEIILQEPHWCVVELSQALSQWEANCNWETGFQYNSMDEEESNLLCFKQSETGEWIIGSAWQLKETRQKVPTKALQKAVRTLVRNVKGSVVSELGVDLCKFKEFAE